MRIVALFTLLLIGQALAVAEACAATHYVRAGATGSGNDWTNAYPALPSTLVRGDTYYVADGNYGTYSFDDAGTALITIKKATAADHGSDSGWNDSYGDGQAVFSGSNAVWSFAAGNYLIDGNQGSGKTNLGFFVQTTQGKGTVTINFAKVSNVTLNRIEAKNIVYYGAEGNLNNVLYGAAGGSNLIVRNSYLHDSNWSAGALMLDWDTLLFENNHWENIYRKELLSCRRCSNVTWRNSFHKNIAGTGYLVGENPSNWAIYGNVFIITDSRYTTTDCIFCNWYGSGMTARNIYIYNNTFYNVLGAAVIGYDSGSNIVAKNNLFYGSGGIAWRGSIDHDYNWCFSSGGSCSAVQSESHGQVGTATIFVDPGNDNFRLKAATNSGLLLSSPYNTDIENNGRGLDSVWDRGAYEFGGSGGTALSAPPNLRLLSL